MMVLTQQIGIYVVYVAPSYQLTLFCVDLADETRTE